MGCFPNGAKTPKKPSSSSWARAGGNIVNDEQQRDPDAVSPDRTLYDRALRASGREAAATLAVAAFTMAYFWAAVWLLEDSDMTILSMPVWFMASCVGGYFVSVAAVWVLVKRCFTDIDLDEAARGYSAGNLEKAGGEDQS